MDEFKIYLPPVQKDGFKRTWISGYLSIDGVWIMGYWCYKVKPQNIRQQVYLRPSISATASLVKIEGNFFPYQNLPGCTLSKWKYNKEQEAWTRIELYSGKTLEVFYEVPFSWYLSECQSDVDYAKNCIAFNHSVGFK